MTCHTTSCKVSEKLLPYGSQSAPASPPVRHPAPALRAHGLVLQVRRVPLRRVGELNRLRGGRYLMSLLLELADLAAPALKALWRNASGNLTTSAGAALQVRTGNLANLFAPGLKALWRCASGKNVDANNHCAPMGGCVGCLLVDIAGAWQGSACAGSSMQKT